MRILFVLWAVLAAPLGCLDVPAEDVSIEETSTSTGSVDHGEFGSDCGRCHVVGDHQFDGGCETCHENPPQKGTHLMHLSFDCDKCHPKPQTWLTQTHPNAEVDVNNEACSGCHGADDAVSPGL